MKKFTSSIPPSLFKSNGKTYVVPGYIEVPENTTLETVYKHWENPEVKKGPGMYCSTEELNDFLNNTWNPKKYVSTKIAEKVTSSNGKTSYEVTFNNGAWNCTCVGFSFRKRCKHVEEVKKMHNIK